MHPTTNTPNVFAPTLAAGTAPASLVAPPPSSGVRSTVLPRVALDAGEPQLVAADRERYEHAHTLGEGGMGEVIKAVDNDIGRTVAVKRLLPEVIREPAAVARFVDEIRTVGQLEHPNIVPIHD